MVALVVLLTTGLTVNTNVAIESHPKTFFSVSINVPAAVIILPFQLYGNWFEQIVVLVVLLTTWLTVSTIVAIESQPETLFKVSLYVPAAVIVLPFQLYGSWFEQMVVLIVLLTTWLTVSTSVAIESQPDTLLNVSL